MPLNPFVKGGLDVPITDGGTGASVAATALSNIGGLDETAHDLLDHTGLTGVGDLTSATHASIDHSVVPATFFNIGTATDANAAGDFAAGLTGAGRMVYDQGTNTLSFYESAGGALQTTFALDTVLTTTSQDLAGAINEVAASGVGGLSAVLGVGNTTGANGIVVSSGQEIEGADVLTLRGSEGIDLVAASSFNIYIGSSQLGGSDNDETHIDSGSGTFIGANGDRTGDVTIGDSAGGNTVTIYGFDAPAGGDFGSITSTPNSSSTGDAGNGLILIDRGGTKFLNTGGSITLGPVYYDPNNGQKIRFGASIFMDGDGVVNTINGGDGTQSLDESLVKLTSDGTQDLAVVGPITDSTLTPGSVTLRGFLASAPTVEISVTDDGAAGFPVSALLPAGGTITYATGAMTGVTASLVDTSEIIALYLVDDTPGEALTPRGGHGTGTAVGGPLNLLGGNGGTVGVGGDGGDATLTSGEGGGSGGASGDVLIDVGVVDGGTVGTISLGIVEARSITIGNVTAGTALVYNAGTGGHAFTGNMGFFGTTPIAKPAAYTPTNVSTVRTYDADATTLNELADVVGTLIADVQSLGLVA